MAEVVTNPDGTRGVRYPQLQFFRGLLANLPKLADGQPGFTTDSHQLFIGWHGDNYLIGGGADLGTVSSVALAAPAEFTVSGSPVTGIGSLTLTWANPVSVAHGGTGDATLAAHGVLIGNGTGAVNVTGTGT